jgi:hypothetical protein
VDKIAKSGSDLLTQAETKNQNNSGRTGTAGIGKSLFGTP